MVDNFLFRYKIYLSSFPYNLTWIFLGSWIFCFNFISATALKLSEFVFITEYVDAQLVTGNHSEDN